ncbi:MULTISPECIES: YegS/Rv2252/BmrU family lipid kinase [unclassified Pseudoalteromonas]|uniref:diacylglycerol/lipid kinase family protein n=1 Tax=unclassified Pseudoalteromonas TaxID=194690 RepID=UPI000C06C310|nr:MULTISPECIES: YegS/Rv2252/BmrU family lipid kinase [unclassified Pseudoalteromonas]MDP2633454.1 YegS/Rv2252/BmrU family lipid kinase [Pseudoalteromonas sp. 1_MG-2023]PHN90521.1 transcriptional regulator [Pseudoalteromonas sp. 3D05]
MLIIIKPSTKKKHKKMFTWLYEECEKRQIYVDTFATTGDFNVDCAKIAQLAKSHVRAVVLGGDGTLHLAVNALLKTGCSLALLPLGTGNDFARGFACSKEAWQQAVFAEQEQAIDIGQINNRYFINVAGVGFDAHVVKALQEKSNLSSLGYSLAGFQHLLKYKPARLNGRFGNEIIDHKNLITVFANHRYFGGGLAIAPKAQLSDGKLECYAMPAHGLFSNLYSFIRLLLGCHHTMRGLSYQRLDKACITSEGLPIEADGELIGETPATITVHPQALRFCVPSENKKSA